jgi:hypothetical protein
MNGVEMRWVTRLGVLAFVGVTILFVVSAPRLSHEEFAAGAGGLQALFLVPALTVAVLTLLADSRDRRVDRVVTLHTELTSGELDAARRRLVKHLRDHRTPPIASRDELKMDHTLSRYSDGQPSQGSVRRYLLRWARRGDVAQQPNRPLDDTNRLLRYFGRAEAMRVAGSLHEPLLVQLIGRHAPWINLAIEPEANNTMRKSLSNFSDWANDYAEINKHKHDFLADWGSNRMKDFGRIR